MFRIAFTFLIIIMFFSVEAGAQKKAVGRIQWSVGGTLPANTHGKSLGLAGPVSGIHNNILIVGGGANFPDSMPWLGGKKKYYDDVYVYMKKGKRFVLHKKRFKLPSTIAYAANCTTHQGLVYAGGENETGISKKVVLVKWNEVTGNIYTNDLPDLPVAVTNAAATVNGNTIYIAGGETPADVSNRFYSLDLNNTAGGWKELPPLPKPVSHSMLTVLSKGNHASIYLIGGRKKNANGVSDLYASVYEFDLKNHKWKQKTSLPYALSAGTGISAGSNQILLFGGDRGETFQKTETLIAAINAENDEEKKQQLNQQKIQLQSAHPGFSKDVLLYNTATDIWAITDRIPFDVPVTTTAIKWKDVVIIPNGEVKAGVRTPHILVGILKKES